MRETCVIKVDLTLFGFVLSFSSNPDETVGTRHLLT